MPYRAYTAIGFANASATCIIEPPFAFASIVRRGDTSLTTHIVGTVGTLRGLANQECPVLRIILGHTDSRFIH